jgi:desulfoferrodoxin (superoxide reductase-like protein)
LDKYLKSKKNHTLNTGIKDSLVKKQAIQQSRKNISDKVYFVSMDERLRVLNISGIHSLWKYQGQGGF